MSDETDPEVIADLQLRAHTERDATRTRGAGAYSWRPPDVVAMWKCRYQGCAGVLGVDADTIERLEMWNRILERKGEPAIRTTEVAICEECRAELKRTSPDRKAKKRVRIGEIIGELAKSTHPRREFHLVHELRDLKYDGVDLLLDAIDPPLGSKRGKTKGKL